jgi:preprotein translocase subunit SecG
MRLVVTVLAVLVALYLVGLVLLHVGGSSPTERGRGSSVELTPRP